eukprot:CAMPEP_0184501888 /NCGR_PEP_ID=MMETSP0113_2-20130426/48852_1 /TAXON_ID=91329 /ORGANISM="Norrisiella sphaerica, Strain BC52" /LENGTH=362 /DNA_ID=CAMNT_0026890819 /DNA_START=44 /DNA_END=1132 /DNA_ORIENTATION=+
MEARICVKLSLLLALTPVSVKGIFSFNQNNGTLFSSFVKSSVEIVLSHYEEDLEWVTDTQYSSFDFTIYSKRPAEDAEWRFGNRFKYVHLPNVGREGHTYLHHIVANYDSLAEWTVFSQAASPNWGFRANSKESGHMCSGVKFMDYTRPNEEGFFMIHTVASHLPQGYQSDRLDMMFHNASAIGGRCPFNGAEGWGSWWFEPDHPVIAFKEQQPNAYDVMDFYNLVLDWPKKQLYSVTLNFANGARFAVSRNRIRSRSVEYYRRLLDALSHHKNPIEGFFLETMWYDVFHPESPQVLEPVCKLPMIAESVGTHAQMFQNVVSKIFHQPNVPEHVKLSSPYTVKPSYSPTYNPTAASPTAFPT